MGIKDRGGEEVTAEWRTLQDEERNDWYRSPLLERWAERVA